MALWSRPGAEVRGHWLVVAVPLGTPLTIAVPLGTSVVVVVATVDVVEGGEERRGVLTVEASVGVVGSEDRLGVVVVVAGAVVEVGSAVLVAEEDGAAPVCSGSVTWGVALGPRRGRPLAVDVAVVRCWVVLVVKAVVGATAFLERLETFRAPRARVAVDVRPGAVDGRRVRWVSCCQASGGYCDARRWALPVLGVVATRASRTATAPLPTSTEATGACRARRAHTITKVLS